MVEFAVLAPLLILLLIGMVEFSWLLARNLDVNQGAREGARLIAVNTPVGNAALQDEICARMDLVGSNPATTVSWSAVDLDGNAMINPGDGVTVSVSAPVFPTLTGLLDFLLAGLTSLDSSVEIRVEQTPDWTAPFGPEACP